MLLPVSIVIKQHSLISPETKVCLLGSPCTCDNVFSIRQRYRDSPGPKTRSSWLKNLVPICLYCLNRSLQKVQGHRTAQSQAGVDVDVTPPTSGPVGHPPNPATLCDRSAQGSKSWHSGSFAKYSDIGLVTISFPTCCASHRATGLPVMVHDMHTRRRRPDYLQACPTGPPVDGVKSALTPALWPCAALYLLQWP